MPDSVPMRVLVIEDDADTRANLCDILELDDHRVFTAATVAETLARTDWAELDAIILDRQLPDGTADELLPKLKRLAPNAAYVVATGYADLEGAIAALRRGASDYLLKPINPDMLRASLSRVVERNRLARDKARSEAAFRHLVEAAASVIFILRPDGSIAYFSPFAEQLTGYRLSEIRGKDYRDLFVPEEFRESFPFPQPAKASAEAVALEGIESPLRNRWGSLHWILWNVRYLPDYEGKPAILAVGQDITLHREAKEALREQRDFAETLIETAQAIVLLLSPEGTIERFNQYMEKLSGFALDEVRGKDWFDTFLPPEDRLRLRELCREVLEIGESQGNCNPIVTKDGSLREIAWWCKALKDAHQNVIGILAIGHDISELRDAQQRALQSERLAAIGQMVAGLAHESRNALQRSQACLEMLALEVEGNDEALDLVNRIQKAQDHLHYLYEEVRSYAAPIRLKREHCRLAELWRETWANLDALLEEKPVELVEQAEACEVESFVDRHALGQVFRNIFENAIAVCPDEGGQITICCEHATLHGRPAILLSIGDNGPGLSHERKRRIFEPFFTTKTKGTGLGMAIAQRIVETHGGTISVGENNPGAVLQITLPRETK